MVPAFASPTTTAGSFTARRRVADLAVNVLEMSSQAAKLPRQDDADSGDRGAPSSSDGRLAAVGKHPPSSRYLLFLSCISLLGVALVADFLWASSTAAASLYFSIEKAIGLLPSAPKKIVGFGGGNG